MGENDEVVDTTAEVAAVEVEQSVPETADETVVEDTMGGAASDEIVEIQSDDSDVEQEGASEAV